MGDTVGGVDAAEEVVEIGRAEQNGERGVLSSGGVEVDEARGELPLGPLEAPFRDGELTRVVREVAPDPVELDVGEVVGLDRPLEARVELLDLGEDALRLGLLRADRRVGERGNGSRREDHCERDD